MRSFPSPCFLLAGLLATTGAFCPAAESPVPKTWQTALNTTIEAAAPISGGNMQGRSLQGLALASVEWNEPGRPRGETGLRAYASVLALSGRGPTGRFAGDLLAVSNIEGHRSVRLYSWWLQGEVGPWQWRAGSLLADDEFAGTNTGSHFVNSAFGWPAFISSNTVNTGPAFYAAAPGVRLRRELGDTGYWQAAVFDGDSFDSAAGDPTINERGVHLKTGGSQGWFALVERGWTPAGSPNRWKVGGWYHTGKFADTWRDEAGASAALTGAPPRLHGGNFGGYASLERTLSGTPDKCGHTAAFLRAGFAPGDRSPIGWAVDAGVARRGLFPTRPDDVGALGYARATFSRDARKHQRDASPGMPVPDFEEAVELTYVLAAAENLTLRPSLQFVRHPGGSSARSNALVGLFRVEASF